MDDTFQAYINRVARMMLPEAFQSQVQYTQPSPKFQQQPDRTFQATPFPGYTVISPPWEEDNQNGDAYTHIQTYQQRILEHLEPGLVSPVPASSFHFTLADLIWDGAYRHASADPSFEPKLHESIEQSFEKCRFLVQAQQPIQWQVIGLFLRTRALGVCLVPNDEESYERVLELRRAIYQNPNLIALGIEQQYNFTAHITLGYFGEQVAAFDRDRLAENLVELNQYWLDLDQPSELRISRAELRKFDDMTRYYREPNWAVLEFV